MYGYDELEREFERVAKKQKTMFFCKKPGHTEKEIAELEEDIGMKIADDYRQFMKKYRIFAMYDDFVVHNLKEYARDINRIRESREEINAPMPDDMYVLGYFDYECPIYLQDTKGRVYEFRWDYKYSKPKKIANNFLEFINQQLEFQDNLPVVE